MTTCFPLWVILNQAIFINLVIVIKALDAFFFAYYTAEQGGMLNAGPGRRYVVIFFLKNVLKHKGPGILVDLIKKRIEPMDYIPWVALVETPEWTRRNLGKEYQALIIYVLIQHLGYWAILAPMQ